MAKFTRIIVVMTLLIFTGQSFAALSMSCDLMSSHSSKSDTFPINHTSVTADHAVLQHSPDLVSLQKIPHKPMCDSAKKSCQCKFGTCTSVFIPVSGLNLTFVVDNRLNLYLDLFISQYPSPLFRPPIAI